MPVATSTSKNQITLLIAVRTALGLADEEQHRVAEGTFRWPCREARQPRRDGGGHRRGWAVIAAVAVALIDHRHSTGAQRHDAPAAAHERPAPRAKSALSAE